MWFPATPTLNKIYKELELNYYKVAFCSQKEAERKKQIYDFGDEVLKWLDSKIDLEDDAKFFYKWIMCYYIPLCYREYATDVLDYFHWRDYLLFKKQIITPKYHKKKRYSVKFFDKDKLFFIKNYTSLRELQDDSGRRATEVNIIPYKAKP